MHSYKVSLQVLLQLLHLQNLDLVIIYELVNLREKSFYNPLYEDIQVYIV